MIRLIALAAALSTMVLSLGTLARQGTPVALCRIAWRTHRRPN